MGNFIIILAGIVLSGLAIGLFCFLMLGLIHILLVTFKNNFYFKPRKALLEHNLQT
jgi:hypothetical protein